MARILRGDVLWAVLNPVHAHQQAGRRPVVVLSEDVFNDRSGTVIAAAPTSREPSAGFPLTFEIRSIELPKRSWIKVGQVRTLSTARLGHRLGRLAPEEVERPSPGSKRFWAGNVDRVGSTPFGFISRI